MKIFFKMIFFVLSFTFMQSVASAQTDPVVEQVDLNAPAPESPIQIRIPHSDRTRENLLDSILDFILIHYFKHFKNTEISYEFFEVDRNYDLNFTNFVVKVKHPDVTGTIVISKVKVKFDEFLSFLKEKKIIVSRVLFYNVSADMTMGQGPEGKKDKRSLKVFAKKLTLKNVLMTAFGKENEKINGQDVHIGNVLIDQAELTLSDPKEKYVTTSAELTDVVLPEAVLDKFTFSTVKVGGKTYSDRKEFLQAIKQ